MDAIVCDCEKRIRQSASKQRDLEPDSKAGSEREGHIC